MEMIFFGETILVIELPQIFCEGIRMHRLSVLVREQIITERESPLQRLVSFLVAVGTNEAHDVFTHVDCPGLTVLSRPLCDAPAWNHAAGAADR